MHFWVLERHSILTPYGLTRTFDGSAFDQIFSGPVATDRGTPTIQPVTSAASNPDRVEASHHGARAIAERLDRSWEISLSAGTGRLGVSEGTTLLRDITGEIASRSGGRTCWRVAAATEEHDRIARNASFSADRRLVQLRRSLPLEPELTGPEPPLEVRPFEPGRDESEWLRVNNAAFAWHPEQSAWTEADLAGPMGEDWFDREGFLLHPSEGPLRGFCWTKEHRDVSPPLGEIFVIAVDPAAAGSGLGRRLVVAGLDHLARRGLGTAILYTEADNAPARRLYERLGFSVHHTVTVYERDV